MARRSWRLQAHWTVGDEQRSYAPTYVHSRLGVRKATREMARTLGHFHGLTITVDPVDRAAALSAERDRAEVLANIEPAMMHLFDEPQTGTLCGTPIDIHNIAATPDMQELSSCERCPQCAALAASAAPD